MGSDRWKEILFAVQLPPDVSGWMDWTTGFLYVDADLSGDLAALRVASQRADPAFQTGLWRNASDDVKQFLETMSHENVHFLQLATTGYMYRWACQLHQELAQIIEPLFGEIRAWFSNPDARLLSIVDTQVDKADRTALRTHLEQLDRVGPNKVSIRCLLEAHAYLVQKKMHWHGLDQLSYLSMLNEEGCGSVYRHAYDLARFRLGDRIAFVYFPVMVSLALCAEDPPQAFDVLLTEAARLSLPPSPQNADWGKLLELERENLSGLLGSSAEVYDRTGLEHPVYTMAVNTINAACARGFTVLEFFADPVNSLQHIAIDTIRPMAYRANAAEKLPLFVPQGMEQDDVIALLLFSIIGSRVLSLESATAGDGTAGQGFEWLPLVRPDLLEISVEPAQLASGDLGAFSTLDPANLAGDAKKKACSRWGRCCLSFDLDGNAPVWARPEVRQFITSLERSNPAFPAYLVPDPAYGMFIVWFGSLADMAALPGSSQSLDLGHTSVVEHLLQCGLAIQRLCGELGYESRPVLQALLAPYSREVVEKLVDVINPNPR